MVGGSILRRPFNFPHPLSETSRGCSLLGDLFDTFLDLACLCITLSKFIQQQTAGIQPTQAGQIRGEDFSWLLFHEVLEAPIGLWRRVR